MPSDKSLANLRPVKKGERRAMKGDKPKTMRLSAYVNVELETIAKELLKKHGSQTKLINHLLASQS